MLLIGFLPAYRPAPIHIMPNSSNKKLSVKISLCHWLKVLIPHWKLEKTEHILLKIDADTDPNTTCLKFCFFRSYFSVILSVGKGMSVLDLSTFFIPSDSYNFHPTRFDHNLVFCVRLSVWLLWWVCFF